MSVFKAGRLYVLAIYAYWYVLHHLIATRYRHRAMRFSKIFLSTYEYTMTVLYRLRRKVLM